MLGYTLFFACGLAIFAQAIMGLRLAGRTGVFYQLRHLSAGFLAFLVLGFAITSWAYLRLAHTEFRAAGVAEIELSESPAAVELERIAWALGVNAKQPLPKMGDEIIRRLPSPVWHLRAIEQDALGLALDQVPAAMRFPVGIHSIPANVDSQAYSDDLIKVFHDHHWTAIANRDFGITPTLTGIVIAVPFSTRTQDDVPIAAKKIIVLLQKGGLKPYGSRMLGLPDGQFEIVVGSGPAQKQLAAP